MNTNYRHVATYPEKVSSTCRVCKKESEKQYQLYQTYFSFFGLPIFPTRKIVYWNCTSCSVRKELKVFSNNTLDGFEQDIAVSLRENNSSHTHFRYYWGSILILMILCFIGYAISSIR